MSLLWQTPPCLQGLSRHSFRSTHDFPSGVTRCPRAQLFYTYGLVERMRGKIRNKKKVLVFIVVNQKKHFSSLSIEKKSSARTLMVIVSSYFHVHNWLRLVEALLDSTRSSLSHSNYDD